MKRLRTAAVVPFWAAKSSQTVTQPGRAAVEVSQGKKKSAKNTLRTK